MSFDEFLWARLLEFRLRLWLFFSGNGYRPRHRHAAHRSRLYYRARMVQARPFVNHLYADARTAQLAVAGGGA